MLETIVEFLKSWFVYPGLSLNYMLVGIGLALVFGAVWLTAYRLPFLRRPWLWAVIAAGAFLSVVAVAFIQLPLQIWVGQVLGYFWSEGDLIAWLALAGIPQVLVSGLVQEGAKMVPMVFWWWRQDRNISPKLGLVIGAAAGAGLGVFEAVRGHCRIFAAGWTPLALQTDGFLAIAGFWERFFVVGFHIAVSALAGYGLAKGKGWQFFLIAAGLHSVLNYVAVLMQSGIFSSIAQVEAYVAALAVLLSGVVILLRWQRQEETDEDEVV